MGTIVSRKRKDGTTGFTAQIVLKKAGEVVWREAKTFDRRPAATAWIKRREAALAEPGAINRAKKPSGALGAVIDRYLVSNQKTLGRTKEQVLNAIRADPISEIECDVLSSQEIVDLARRLFDEGRTPATVSNYLSHLSPIFKIARPAWGYPLDEKAMIDALVVAKELGLTGKSKRRDRRPSLVELDKIMAHFAQRSARRPSSAAMHKIVAFAIFSTRREDEISRIHRKDYEPEHSRILVRDMKDPEKKDGNHIWCDLTPEAMRIIDGMPQGERLFPVSADAISAAFTRACAFLGIDDLVFHDLRHDGISRLFEMGKTIPQAASVSGHRSWSSLQRYTHIRQSGDKYAGWKWLEIVSRPK